MLCKGGQYHYVSFTDGQIIPSLCGSSSPRSPNRPGAETEIEHSPVLYPLYHIHVNPELQRPPLWVGQIDKTWTLSSLGCYYEPGIVVVFEMDSVMLRTEQRPSSLSYRLLTSYHMVLTFSCQHDQGQKASYAIAKPLSYLVSPCTVYIMACSQCCQELVQSLRIWSSNLLMSIPQKSKLEVSQIWRLLHLLELSAATTGLSCFCEKLMIIQDGIFKPFSTDLMLVNAFENFQCRVSKILRFHSFRAVRLLPPMICLVVSMLPWVYET